MVNALRIKRAASVRRVQIRSRRMTSAVPGMGVVVHKPPVLHDTASPAKAH
jgi:hypothetical protein